MAKVFSRLRDSLRGAPAAQSALAAPVPAGTLFTPEQVAHAMYAALLGRAPDEGGLRGVVDYLRQGGSLESALGGMLHSSESSGRRLQELLPPHRLPDLRERFPDRYHVEVTEAGDPALVLRLSSEADFDELERLIHGCRYYDVPGVWGAKIDLDKQVTAALVEGLAGATGGRRCLELGCFTGAVLSLLAARGMAIRGIDASHLAFVLAYPEVRDHLVFGDLLGIADAALGDPFDVVYAMDILEHFNPVRLDRYLARIEGLLAPGGHVLVNSPMFGADDMFGTVFERYLKEWQDAGDTRYWHHLDCDELGWPKHGHLVWAGPAWWEARCAAHGLVRDRAVEAAIHARLAGFFAQAPGRKSFFVLRRDGDPQDSARTVRDIGAALDRLPEIGQA